MTTFFAATGADIVRMTERANGTWEIESSLDDAGAQCLAIDPDNPRRIYAGTFDDGVFRSTDGGSSWRSVGDDIPNKRVLSIAISPSRKVNGPGVVYAGTEPSSLYVSEDDGQRWHDLPALRDLPSAPTWSFPPRPWTSHVRWIAPSWHDPELLFAGIELGGVMRSVDGGETWEDRKPGSYHDSHCVLTHPVDQSRVYEAAGGGAAISLDTGETWQEVDDGMDRHYVWGLAADPEDPDRWYVSASFGAGYAHRSDGSAEAVIFRRQGDDPWEPVSSDLGNPMREMPYALLVPRDNRDRVYTGTRQGSLYISEDRGGSWRKTDVGLPGILALGHALGD